MFPQYSIKARLKEYIEPKNDSVLKELVKMVYQDVFGKVNYRLLSPQQHEWALLILLFVVMKWNGTQYKKAFMGH